MHYVHVSKYLANGLHYMHPNLYHHMLISNMISDKGTWRKRWYASKVLPAFTTMFVNHVPKLVTTFLNITTDIFLIKSLHGLFHCNKIKAHGYISNELYF